MLGRRLINTMSAALWNSLPNDIKFARKIIHFKKIIKPFTTSFFLKEDFIRKSTKHNTKKLQLFTKYIQTHHHKDFKHCTS